MKSREAHVEILCSQFNSPSKLAISSKFSPFSFSLTSEQMHLSFPLKCCAANKQRVLKLFSLFFSNGNNHKSVLRKKELS